MSNIPVFIFVSNKSSVHWKSFNIHSVIFSFFAIHLFSFFFFLFLLIFFSPFAFSFSKIFRVVLQLSFLNLIIDMRKNCFFFPRLMFNDLFHVISSNFNSFYSLILITKWNLFLENLMTFTNCKANELHLYSFALWRGFFFFYLIILVYRWMNIIHWIMHLFFSYCHVILEDL